MPSFLAAAADPLGHVVDKPLGEGLWWHHDHESALRSFAEGLAAIGLTKHVFLVFLAAALTLLFFWSYARKAATTRVPGRWGNFVEMVLQLLRDQLIRPFMGEEGDKFLPLIATFFVFIASCNLLGLVPLFDFLGHGGNTATASIAITGGLAICSFLLYHGLGIREQGNFFLYVKNLFPHVPLFILPLLIVVELIAHCVRPFALAVRLFANMVAGHTLVAAILGFTAFFTAESTQTMALGGSIAAISAIAVVLLTFLEILVALIQAFVFTFLTTVFLSMAVHPEH